MSLLVLIIVADYTSLCATFIIPDLSSGRSRLDSHIDDYLSLSGHICIFCESMYLYLTHS